MNFRSHDSSITAHPGTCEWVFHHGIFQTWIASNQAILWIKGNPGAGKSTLLKHILTHIGRAKELAGLKFSPLDNLTLNFFFHGRGSELQKTATGFYRSLLFQLLQSAPNLLSGVVKDFTDNQRMRGQHGADWQWSDYDLRQLMRRSLAEVSERVPVWIIIDALDEGNEDAAVQLVDEFDLWLSSTEPTAKGRSLHICFSSRYFPVVPTSVALQLSVERENQGDIGKFTVSKLQRFQVRDEEMKTMIVRKSRGLFLWVILVFEKIRKLFRTGRINQNMLKTEIEKAPETLKDLFISLLREIQEEDKTQGLELLRWVLCAKTILSLDMLRFALAIDPDCTLASVSDCQESLEYMEGDEHFERRIIRLSCGLIEVSPLFDYDALRHLEGTLEQQASESSLLYEELDDYSSVIRTHSVQKSKDMAVQFFHQSVRDFILECDGLSLLDSAHKTKEISLSTANQYLSGSCIKFIILQGDMGRFSSYDELEAEYRQRGHQRLA